jgi:hypothetical protein
MNRESLSGNLQNRLFAFGVWLFRQGADVSFHRNSDAAKGGRDEIRWNGITPLTQSAPVSRTTIRRNYKPGEITT